MQNAASAGSSEKGFEVAGMVPHHGRDAITGAETEIGEGGSEAAGAVIEISIAGAGDGTVRAAGNDFDAREEFVGALEERGKRQGKIHHRAAHLKASPIQHVDARPDVEVLQLPSPGSFRMTSWLPRVRNVNSQERGHPITEGRQRECAGRGLVSAATSEESGNYRPTGSFPLQIG